MALSDVLGYSVIALFWWGRIMEWFFAFNDNARDWFANMVKVAVVSARKHTKLKPHCLYDGEPSKITDWLQINGVSVHFTKVPFKDELSSAEVISRNEGSHYRPGHAAGGFLKLFAADFAKGDHFLYTDCDVFFLGDVRWTNCNFGAVGESVSGFNAGVLFLEKSSFLSARERLIPFLRENAFYDKRHSSYDQVLLNTFFKDRWTPLDARFNWRPWQGIEPHAKIIHFHGPKPHRLGEIIQGRHGAEEAGLLAIIERAPDAYRHYLELYEAFLASASPQPPAKFPGGAAYMEGCKIVDS